MFEGIVIAESLADKKILSVLHIVKTEIEKVTSSDNTPWIRQWTMHTVRITNAHAARVAREISAAIDSRHVGAWYADFRNNENGVHYVVFYKKVFRILDSDVVAKNKVVEYGLKLGIPKKQLDF